VTRRRSGLVAAEPHESNNKQIKHIKQASAMRVNKKRSRASKDRTLQRTSSRTRQNPHDSVAQPHATEPRAPARQLTLSPHRQLAFTCSSAPVDRLLQSRTWIRDK
jgi:hypothetical protein